MSVLMPDSTPTLADKKGDDPNQARKQALTNVSAKCKLEHAIGSFRNAKKDCKPNCTERHAKCPPEPLLQLKLPP